MLLSMIPSFCSLIMINVPDYIATTTLCLMLPNIYLEMKNLYKSLSESKYIGLKNIKKT